MAERKPPKIGRYQIIEEIGRGQMGVVYKAQDPTMDRTVAVKVVHVERFTQPDVLTECLQGEAKLAGNLRHPSIVTIHDAGKDEETGDPFIVMEYLGGPTLAEQMASGISSQQAIDIALQLCDALGYAHKQGMVHGDLKPSNIKVLENLKVKITDFGLARSLQAAAAEGTFTGTLAYASPEQLRGDEIDGRSDVFSLGVILFQMLTGSQPFENNDLRREKLVQGWLDRIPSNSLRKCLLRALSREASQRYQTCAVLADDLRRYQGGDSSIVTENPFIYGNPITERQHFYGRQQEMQTIVSRLKGITPASSAIIGGRRIGKTSLLRMLCHPLVIRAQGFTDEYIFVYLYPFITKENQHSDVETQLWKLILQGIRPRLPKDTPLISMIDETSKQGRITYTDFKEIVAKIHEAGFKVVLLFDEFQHVVGNEALKPELFGGLRNLTQSYSLAYITASGKNLRELSKRKEVATSPLWNVFTNVYLGPFSEEEARDLVTGYTRKTDISFTAEDFDYVMHISGGHPYFLQLACYYVFDAYRKGKWGGGLDQEKVRQDIEEEFFKQAESHFADFWDQSTEGEKRFLVTLAYQSQTGKDRSLQQEQLELDSGPGLKSLSERSLSIRTGSSSYRILSPLFAKWIRQHVEDDFDNELKPHFHYFWEQAKNDERRTLLVLARQAQDRRLAVPMAATQFRGLNKQAKSNLGTLMKRGLVIRTDDGNHRIFTPLFSEWILSQQGSLRDRFSLVFKRYSAWLRKARIGLTAIILVLSAILVLPDVPDLVMKALKVENMTLIEGLLTSAGEPVHVKVYSPKLLFVGETDTIQMQTYGAEEPVFVVTVQPGSPDVFIRASSNNAFEIECKGTNANVFSQSEHVELTVKATMPTGNPAAATVTVKTNHLLSLLVRVGVLLASLMVVGGLGVKELSEWLRAIMRKTRIPDPSGSKGSGF